MSIQKISQEEALGIMIKILEDRPSAPDDGPPVSFPFTSRKRLQDGHRQENAFLARSMGNGGHKVVRY